MLIKTRGIILRSIKYSETSIISDIYTEEKGLRSYIISGVRKKNARISPSLLQVMTLVEIVAYHRDDKELCRIKEIKTAEVYSSIPFDFLKGSLGLFIAELAQKTIQEAEENQALFNFLFDTFLHLDKTPHSIANLHLHFMLTFSTFLGFRPDGKYSELSPLFDLKEGIFTKQVNHVYFLKPTISQILDQLLNSTAQNSHLIKLSKANRKLLLTQLINYYRLHIENLPTINAHTILQEVLDD